MNIKLHIWVSSECNLSCPLCNEKNTICMNRGYQMDLAEIDSIVESCKQRNIRFSVIELIGGEVTLWKNFREGVRRFKEISDDLFLVTNGNNQQLLRETVGHWITSTSQASKKQIEEVKDIPSRATFNTHSHKPVPVEPMEGVLPADCVVDRSPSNPSIKENGLVYIRGKVYYCCTTFALSDRVPLTDDMWCSFEDDFIAKFAVKTFDKEICKYCLCNSKIYSRL